MKKTRATVLALTAALACCLIAGCGGGEKSDRTEQQVREKIKETMKRAEERKGELDARAAHDLALKEARQWDPGARVYQLDGQDNLQPDGTAQQWTAYFATQEDPENAPSRDQGKKFVVLMAQSKVVQAEKKETQEEISWTAECHAFLPEGWMNSGQAYEKCLAALKNKHGAEADNARDLRLSCAGREYYESGRWVTKPVWEFSCEIGGSPAHAHIHAVTGEVVEVK